MNLTRLAGFGALALTAAVSSLAAVAQTFPARPVKIIVPFGPGGAADSLPRLVGTKLADIWGQPVVIENRTGAAGNIGMEAAARAAPDGYTLLSAPVGNLAVNPHLYPSFRLDVFKELAPITLVASVQNVLVVNASVPAPTLADLIALLKQRPGSLSFASGGNGTQAHLGGEILKSMAGVEMAHIAYKGVGDAVRDVLGGHAQMMVAQIPSVLAHIQSGKLRALGVAAARRTGVLPGVPTMNEAGGFSGFEAVSWYALMAPAGLPQAIGERVQADVARALAMPDVREKLLALGADPVGSTAAELVTVMRADFDRYGAVVKRLGIRAD